MNVFFQWQFPRRGCLFLLVAISVSTLGCRDSGQDAGSQQQPIAIQIDEVTEASELVQTTQRLRVLIDEARQNVEQREWNEAIEKYTTVLRHQWSDTVDKRQISLHNAEVFLSRGQAFLAKDFPQVAIEDFGDAIKSGDDDLKAKAYVERAKAEAQLKHWSRVVSDCTSAIRLQPKTGEAFLLNSRALAELGKFDQARNSMLEAEQLGIRTTWKVPIPESGRSMLDQAQSSLEMDRPIVAREILETAKQEGKDNWETNGLLAQALFELNEFDRAIWASTRALRQNPQHADAYRIRGLSWIQQRNFDRAISDLNAAVALDATLTEQLQPYLTEARRRGGLHPTIRAEATLRIKQLAAAEIESASIQGDSERWLLELIELPNSSAQIDHFRNLLAETSEERLDSSSWLTDFLMLEYRVSAANAIRTWLDRKSPDVPPVAQRLWESVASRKAAASHGVNMFPDFAAYAIEYEFNDVLRTCIDLGICHINIDHMHQAVEHADTRCLKLILPHTTLPDREIAGLLRHCLEKNKQDHVRLIIDRYERSLTYEILEFLGMTNELEHS